VTRLRSDLQAIALMGTSNRTHSLTHSLAFMGLRHTACQCQCQLYIFYSECCFCLRCGM